MNRTRLFLLPFILLLASCATTHIEESWTLPEYTPPTDKKVLVIVLAAKQKVREVFETQFVNQLNDKGLAAIASHTWIPDGSNINRDMLRPLIKQNGITMVLVSSLKSVEKSQAYQPAQPTGPSDNLNVSLDSYITFDSSGKHVSGSYAELNDYLVETNAFDSRTEKLSWSATTRTSDQSHMEKIISDVVSTVVKQGRKDRIF